MMATGVDAGSRVHSTYCSLAGNRDTCKARKLDASGQEAASESAVPRQSSGIVGVAERSWQNAEVQATM